MHKLSNVKRLFTVLSLGTILLMVGCSSMGDMKPMANKLRCEYLVNPHGIDVSKPRLSWILDSDGRGQKQRAYHILVAGSAEKLRKNVGDLWDSNRVDSDQSIHIEYAGKPLQSHMRCYWKVRIWDKDNKVSSWSEPAFWSMGILQRQQWQAKWLGYTKIPETWKRQRDWKQKGPSPVFRKAFSLDKPIKSATVYICGLGYYELRLNGRKVGDNVLDPAFTRYDKRVLYVTHDVTKQIRQGKNAFGVMLGNGWYNVHTRAVWKFDQAPWRDRPKMLLQCHIVFSDGSTEIISSDESWRADSGPVILDGIRKGECYDARLEMPGWDTPDYDDSGWPKPELVKAPAGILSAQMLPPIKVTQTIKPVSVSEPSPGEFVFDMGQNFAGWAQLKVTGPAGTTVTMRYGEELNPDGTVRQDKIKCHTRGSVFQTDAYTLKGKGLEIWEPRFTYHGFRYVQVTGFPGKPSVDNIRGRVVHTSFSTAGSFECSKKLLNDIQRITLWAYRSNYHGIPTDCPHREKDGWTGDAHLAAEQAMYNFHNTTSYTKWLYDIMDEQQQSGALPGIVPTGGWGYKWGNGQVAGPAWDSAYIIIPWYLYRYSGDKRVLAVHYDRLKRYVDYLTKEKSKDYIVSFGLGDWLPAKTTTPAPVTSTGYYYVDTLIVAKIARILGRSGDAEKYEALAEKIKSAFNKTFYKGNGLYSNGSQTALSCALYQGLVDTKEKDRVVEKLVDNIKQNDEHIDTGILGAKYLFHSLTKNGQHDLAYRIATQTSQPSYGFWVKSGATTLREGWKNPHSLNHICFGDISTWFYQTLVGINLDPKEIAFKHTIIRPRPIGDLTWVNAAHESMYGTIHSSWRIDDGDFFLNITIPANTSATVYIPTVSAGDITESGKPADKADGVNLIKTEAGSAVYRVQSGKYAFVSKYLTKK